MKSFILSSCLGVLLPFLLVAQSTPIYTCQPVGMSLYTQSTVSIFNYIPPLYSQLLYKHSDFPGLPMQGVITDLYVQLRTKTSKGFKLDNLTIQMGMTSLCGFTMSMYMQNLPMITAGMDTVFYDSSYILADSIPSGAWWRIPLQQPFHYNFTTGSIDSCKNLLLEIYGRGDPAFDGAPFAINGMEPQVYSLSASERLIWADSATKHYIAAPTILYMIGFNPKPDPVWVKEVSNSQLSIYPNPATATIQFSLKGSYTISTLQGIIVQRGEGDAANVGTLPQGLYLVQLTTKNGERLVGRFLKE